MNKQAGAIVVSILFAVGIAGCSSPPPPSAPASSGMPPRVVTGELQKIEGDYYTVKDQSGREVRFQIIPNRTMMNIQPNVGDKITAQVEPQGYAFSINPVK